MVDNPRIPKWLREIMPRLDELLAGSDLPEDLKADILQAAILESQRRPPRRNPGEVFLDGIARAFARAAERLADEAAAAAAASDEESSEPSA